MSAPLELNAPWSLRFDRDGTEDVGQIVDSSGEVIIESRDFWLPERDDPTPPTLAALWAMTAAPALIAKLVRSTQLLCSLFDSAISREKRDRARRILDRIDANLNALDLARGLPPKVVRASKTHRFNNHPKE